MSTTTAAGAVRCGTCGRALDPAQADLAVDGYRCLSCAIDDQLAANIAERRRDALRIGALHRLRLALYSFLALLVAAFALPGIVRVTLVVLMVPVVAFGVGAVRRLMR